MPLLGSNTAILSHGDIRDDDLRVEVYCDNEDCAVREMTILAMRFGDPQFRADVQALHEVDSGVESERSPSSLSSASEIPLPSERNRSMLERRRRVTHFKLDLP